MLGYWVGLFRYRNSSDATSTSATENVSKRSSIYIISGKAHLFCLAEKRWINMEKCNAGRTKLSLFVISDDWQITTACWKPRDSLYRVNVHFRGFWDLMVQSNKLIHVGTIIRWNLFWKFWARIRNLVKSLAQ